MCFEQSCLANVLVGCALLCTFPGTYAYQLCIVIDCLLSHCFECMSMQLSASIQAWLMKLMGQSYLAPMVLNKFSLNHLHTCQDVGYIESK